MKGSTMPQDDLNQEIDRGHRDLRRMNCQNDAVIYDLTPPASRQPTDRDRAIEIARHLARGEVGCQRHELRLLATEFLRVIAR